MTATDGRRVLLTVTKAGREAAERGRTPRGEQLAEGLSSGFTDEELEQLVAVAPLLGRLLSRRRADQLTLRRMAAPAATVPATAPATAAVKTPARAALRPVR